MMTTSSRFMFWALALSPLFASDWSPPLTGQERTSPSISLASVLATHRAWTIPPASIEIRGTSTTGAKTPTPGSADPNTVTEPVRVFATREEEALTEYGTLGDMKSVSTPSISFREDAAKTTHAATRSGFAQLDVTSIFLLAQASLGNAKSSASQTEGGSVKLTVDRERTELHYGKYKVNDTFEISIGRNGLVESISRSFYPKSVSLHYTQSSTFSDYRDTGGVLLPYKIRRYMKGQLVQTIDVTEYRLDLGRDPALFESRKMR